MSSSLRLLALLLFGVAAMAADAPTSRPAAAMSQYKDAVAAADRVRDKSVEKARDTLVKDLKAAQKTAMQQGDLASANAIEDMIKSDPATVVAHPPEKDPKDAPEKETKNPQPPFVGPSWKPAAGGAFTFVNDGTTQSSVDGPGHWKLLSERSVLVTFNDHPDWVRIFNFDDTGKSFNSVSYQQQETDTGSNER